jgi:hypothetical protein
MLRDLIRAFLCAAAASTVGAQGAPSTPPPIEVLAAPVGGLVAIARSPVPSSDLPEKEDFDSTLVVVKDAAGRVIAKRLFSSRFISKMLWSPDGKFLALCSESAGATRPGT